MDNSKILSKKHLFVGILLGLLVVYFLGQAVTQNRLQSAASYLESEIRTQEVRLSGLLTLLRHGGGTTSVDALIIDCPTNSRVRFDSLLSQIESLNQGELVELRGLFPLCADYFSKRRAAVFAQFEREVEALRQLRSVEVSLDLAKAEESSDWSTELEQERVKVNVLNSLVRIQGEIIEILYEGEGIDSPRIKALLEESIKLREELVPSGV